MQKVQDRTFKRIDFLDYMRVFAFTSVFIGHKFSNELLAASNDLSLHVTLRLFLSFIIPLTHGGAAGVLVFFLVSGYIITHVLRSERVLEFSIKRIFRIYPLYIFAIITEFLFAFFLRNEPMPSLSIWIPRLLLVGDFFGTPYALAGVEWTLRIEILFYIFMVCLKASGVMKKEEYLPLIFLGFTLLINILPPFPLNISFTNGYLSLYGPFLLMGSLIYLSEQKLSSAKASFVCIALMVLIVLIQLPKIQPAWKDSNYAVAALFLFAVSWLSRDFIHAGRIVRLLSELTYAVYLFHNWIWDYFMELLGKTSIEVLPAKFVTVLMVLVLCYLLNKSVEKMGIKMGKRMLQSIPTISSGSKSLS